MDERIFGIYEHLAKVPLRASEHARPSHSILLRNVTFGGVKIGGVEMPINLVVRMMKSKMKGERTMLDIELDERGPPNGRPLESLTSSQVECIVDF